MYKRNGSEGKTGESKMEFGEEEKRILRKERDVSKESVRYYELKSF